MAAHHYIIAGLKRLTPKIPMVDMGKPVKIRDLALQMIELSGLVPEKDIPLQYTGLRPGEKLYEELLVDGNAKETKIKLIMLAVEPMIDWSELEPLLVTLKEACLNNNSNDIRQILIKLVPGFKPQSPILDFTDND